MNAPRTDWIASYAAARGRPCLLVVDDQPVNVQALFRIFGNDAQVLAATTGADAIELARDRQPDLVLLDVVMPTMDGFEVLAQLRADARTADIPVIFVTAQNDAQEETRALEAGAVDFISKPVNPTVVRARVRTHLQLKSQSDLLKHLAFVDGLTGVLNRRGFDERLAHELQRAQRSEAALAVLMIDVDDFKGFNDRFGHQAGDACLKRVAEALVQAMRRPADTVVRYGGEEFACLLPATDLDGAAQVASACLDAVRALHIDHPDARAAPVITISIGVAAWVPGDPMRAEWLASVADARLYAAKRAGRACVCADPRVDAHA